MRKLVVVLSLLFFVVAAMACDYERLVEPDEDVPDYPTIELYEGEDYDWYWYRDEELDYEEYHYQLDDGNNLEEI